MISKLYSLLAMVFVVSMAFAMTPLDAIHSAGESAIEGCIDLQHTNNSVFNLSGFYNPPLGAPHYYMANESIEYTEMIAANNSISSI